MQFYNESVKSDFELITVEAQNIKNDIAIKNQQICNDFLKTGILLSYDQFKNEINISFDAIYEEINNTLNNQIDKNVEKFTEQMINSGKQEIVLPERPKVDVENALMPFVESLFTENYLIYTRFANGFWTIK